MGFVKQNVKIEQFLTDESVSWRLLGDKEYKEVMLAWRASFDAFLVDGKGVKGANALYCFKKNVPMDGFVFNAPNYKYLKKTFGAGHLEATFGYEVNGFKGGWGKMNGHNEYDMIVCDRRYRFMCVFSVEPPDLIPKIFCEITND